MYPFWVEIPVEVLMEVAAAGLMGLVCLLQALLLPR